MKEPNNEAEDLESGAEDTKSERPVRMKWGRPVEEPPLEVPPTEKKEEKPVSRETELPTPDPRIDALRLRLAKMAEREAAERASDTAETEKRASAEEELRAKREEEEARRAAARERALEEERQRRIREELRAEQLRKEMRKRNRRNAFKRGCAAILGRIVGLFRGIRVTKKQILAVSVVLVLTVTLTVILGNLLKGRVHNGDVSETTEPQASVEETYPYYSQIEIPRIQAGVVSLEGTTAGTLRSEARRFSSSGVKAVSLILRSEAGDLLFDARTDGALGLQPAEEELLGIDEILAPFKAEGLYISCLLPMRYGIDGDEYSASVLYAYETALLTEVAAAGADEVVLVDADGIVLSDVDEGESSLLAEQAIEEICNVAHTVRARVPDVAIGISFGTDFLASRESDRYLSEIVRAFDLSMLDLRSAASLDEAYQRISEDVSAHLYFILRYSMRVLIPAGCAEAVTSADVYSWQEGTLPLGSSAESTGA